MPSERQTLMRKELRQLLRSRGALYTSLIMPTLLLLVTPLSEWFGIRAFSHGKDAAAIARELALAGGPQSESLPEIFRHFFPMLVAMGGLIVPAVTAIHTVISERDSRTFELLAALPVRISEVLFAKLGVILLVSMSISFVLLGIDAVIFVSTGYASIAYMLSIFALSVLSMAYSATCSLLTALVSRDFRTANQINGILLAPTIFGCMLIIGFVPGDILRVWILAGAFAAAAAICAFVSIKIVSFERMLS